MPPVIDERGQNDALNWIFGQPGEARAQRVGSGDRWPHTNVCRMRESIQSDVSHVSDDVLRQRLPFYAAREVRCEFIRIGIPHSSVGIENDTHVAPAIAANEYT